MSTCVPSAPKPNPADVFRTRPRLCRRSWLSGADGGCDDRSYVSRCGTPSRYRDRQFKDGADPLATQHHHLGVLACNGAPARRSRCMGRGLRGRPTPRWRAFAALDGDVGVFLNDRTTAPSPGPRSLSEKFKETACPAAQNVVPMCKAMRACAPDVTAQGGIPSRRYPFVCSQLPF
jgi:hypothetical protein